MIGMNNELGRSINFDFVGNIFDIVLTLFRTSSLPYMLLIFIGFIWLAIKSQKKKSDLLEDSILIYFAMFFIMLGFMGGGVRWIPIFVPFMSLILGVFITFLTKKYNAKKVIIFICLVLLLELFYSINTNILLKPIGKRGVFSSDVRNYSVGFNELEKYLNKELYPFPKKYRVSKKSDLVASVPSASDSNSKIVMYDSRINWFAKSWYIEKYFIYYKIPVFSYDNGGIRNIVIPKNNIEMSSLAGSDKILYFIEAVNDSVMSADNFSESNNRINDFINKLKESNTAFVDIRDRQGSVVFRVYRIEL